VGAGYQKSTKSVYFTHNGEKVGNPVNVNADRALCPIVTMKSNDNVQVKILTDKLNDLVPHHLSCSTGIPFTAPVARVPAAMVLDEFPGSELVEKMLRIDMSEDVEGRIKDGLDQIMQEGLPDMHKWNVVQKHVEDAIEQAKDKVKFKEGKIEAVVGLQHSLRLTVGVIVLAFFVAAICTFSTLHLRNLERLITLMLT
jgi:hypothetical protein